MFIIKIKIMASSKRRSDGFIGRTGNTVVYLLNGKLVKREIGVTTKPPTIPQLASRQITGITAQFLGTIKEFINLGFKQEAERAKKSAYISATSYNRLNAITGAYPDYKIDYSRVLLSKGNKPKTENVKMEPQVEGLRFTWDPSLSDSGKRWTDQVMMMAYLPELNEAVYLLNGARRTEGQDILVMPQFREPVSVETYVSFIAANHKSVSDSIYTGQVLWKSF